MLHRISQLFKRSPLSGDGKEIAMPDVPSNPSAPAEPTVDVQRQLADLAGAVRELSNSQQALLEAVAARPTPEASDEISGDPGDGVRPAAAMDYSRLSPLQQITLGLRNATSTRVPAPPNGAAETPPTPAAGAD